MFSAKISLLFFAHPIIGLTTDATGTSKNIPKVPTTAEQQNQPTLVLADESFGYEGKSNPSSSGSTSAPASVNANTISQQIMQKTTELQLIKGMTAFTQTEILARASAYQSMYLSAALASQAWMRKGTLEGLINSQFDGLTKDTRIQRQLMCLRYVSAMPTVELMSRAVNNTVNSLSCPVVDAMLKHVAKSDALMPLTLEKHLAESTQGGAGIR